ncbi:hypothetical protein D0T53_07110 [Dysgonomonas sp. 216]|uniref:peptidylprolyl isomerase n=1 Tax=Dysgonomonas sp. 216 TaxID=2302934 RepID=UPI0013D23C12|nr:peptidylprolyl isomerase [Dysgonomonas sp. 216]NDW18315.1 hypothetical protein [Dysgonomonas sp. 216]NDW18683.1 hypothetical protein [Dysgonomonas sp. 216]
MNKTLLLLLSTFAVFSNVSAQDNDPVLMKVNGHPVHKSEFEYLYKKNSASVQQSLDEYLPLFIDYKLKIEEAKSQKLDTIPAFIKEFATYKKQLSRPYLTDTVSIQTVAHELYDSMGEGVETSHILFRFPEGVILPKDTLAVYEKALSVRQMLEKPKGKKAKKNSTVKSFEDLALEYSEDPSAARTEKPGYLGWTTAGMLVEPFEKVANTTPVGEVSMPVRTLFGYHLIKVHNRRPSQGKINIAHIMFGFSHPDTSVEQKDSIKKIAQEVYNKLVAGADYSELSKEYSTDRQSAEKGGKMGWIDEYTRLPRSFTQAAYSIKKEGDITEPIETAYGYHILKLEGKAPRDSWKQSKERLVNIVNSSDRVEDVRALKNQRLEKLFNFKANKAAYDELNALANDYSPADSVFNEKTANNNEVLFNADGVNYRISDFSKYVANNAKSSRTRFSTDMLKQLLSSYEESVLFNIEENSLEKRFPEYRNLLREYNDGILLFNVMNEEVWDKTAKDDEGLAEYFKNNNSKYVWENPKHKGLIIHCADEATLKAAKKLANKNKKAKNQGEIILEALNNDSVKNVRVQRSLFAKGENKFVDQEVFKTGEKAEPLDKYPYFFVIGKVIPKPEEYSDVKGQVISDLQEVREKEWMEALRKKYPVEVNEAILKSIK